MYFHVYLIYRFTRTFTDHSSVITRCWGFELQNGKSSLKSPQTLAAQGFAPASFLSTHSTWSQSSLCDHVFLCLQQKSRHPPAPLLLRSNCDPLCWARSWWAALRAAFLQTSGRTHFLAPPFQAGPTSLGSGLVPLYGRLFFVFGRNIGFDRPLQNKRHLRKAGAVCYGLCTLWSLYASLFQWHSSGQSKKWAYPVHTHCRRWVAGVK